MSFRANVLIFTVQCSFRAAFSITSSLEPAQLSSMPLSWTSHGAVQGFWRKISVTCPKLPSWAWFSMVSHHFQVINQHCDHAPTGTAGAMVLWDWRKTKFSGDVLDGGQLHEGHFCKIWSGKFCHRIKRLLQCLPSTSVFCCWRLLATYLGYGRRWAEVSLATGGLHFIVLKAILIYSW